MKFILKFNSDQCVEIKTNQQFQAVRHLLRNPKDKLVITKPIYLEWAESVTRGKSIGYGMEPVNTWTGAPLEVLTFEQAIKKSK